MLKSIFISDLYGKELNRQYNLHKNINIITGVNGAGKTTFIKLVWYLISGNLERALEEIDFSSVKLIHELFTLIIKRTNDNGKVFTTIEFKCSENEECYTYEIETVNRFGEDTFLEHYKLINNINHIIIKYSKVSLFFPTFRRIEGGFSFDNEHMKYANRSSFQNLVNYTDRIGKDLSVYNHKLIASVSTGDINELMKNEYLYISEKSLKLNNVAMNEIKNIITKNNLSTVDISQENFDAISSVISRVDKDQKAIERPKDELANFIKTIYKYKGISFSNKITIGDTNEALSSNKLSAGEKQMLSFLCYNAFTTNGILFIDEPELSLHVDWQRILIKTMLKQNTTNQLIFATHSPFIYSQYEQNEIILDENRGYTNEKSSTNL